MKNNLSNMQLDQEEKSLLSSLENGEWHTVKSVDQEKAKASINENLRLVKLSKNDKIDTYSFVIRLERVKLAI